LSELFDDDMTDYSLLCKAYKAISPDARKEIDRLFGRCAIDGEPITGTGLRVDTTACETNVRYPTDSGLLWDGYRVTSGLIGKVTEYDAE
jgi:hypothetical protein